MSAAHGINNPAQTELGTRAEVDLRSALRPLARSPGEAGPLFKERLGWRETVPPRAA